LGAKGNNGIYPVYWSQGDKIVVNGILSDEVQIDAENRASAHFHISSDDLTYPYHITYPYCSSSTAECPIVEFPANQTFVEGGFATNCAPMCSYVDNKNDKIVLNHLSTILHFPIKAKHEEVVLSKVVVTSISGAKIAGEYMIDCQKATLMATDNSESVVTYSLPANFTLSTSATRELFIILPAIEVGACRVEFVEASGEKMTTTWRPNAPLSRGVVREFMPISYQKGYVGELGTMGSYEDVLKIPLQKYAKGHELKIMSFNIRTDTSESNPDNNWSNRKAACVELIKDQRPHIIGFQEAKFTSQWVYIKEQLADTYDGYGVNRDTGKESGTGETMGILYNKSIIEKIDGGTFWLSETPDTPSKGFGANHSRNATWGIFRHKPTNELFYYINTHLDHQVANAQIEGMKLISKHLEENKETYPLFLTGDLNIKSDNVALDPIEGYMYNTRDAAPSSLTDFNTTFNAYTTTKSSIIDHIYCSDYLQVMEYHTINEMYGGVNFVSDHYPVYAIVKL
jgi:endonuclease/exonuclease/phosphatase family metal-dependent hydrolase